MEDFIKNWFEERYQNELATARSFWVGQKIYLKLKPEGWINAEEGIVTEVHPDLGGPELFRLIYKATNGNWYEVKVNEVRLTKEPIDEKLLETWSFVKTPANPPEMDFRVDKTMPADPDLRGNYVRIIPGTLQGFAFELALVVRHDLIQDIIDVRLAKDNRLVKGFRYRDLKLVRKV